jgi:hypothetical protein
MQNIFLYRGLANFSVDVRDEYFKRKTNDQIKNGPLPVKTENTKK